MNACFRKYGRTGARWFAFGQRFLRAAGTAHLPVTAIMQGQTGITHLS